MNQKFPSDVQEEHHSWGESISQFLQDNPDYFLQHPDILASLTVPHHNSGGAISLIERQVQILREQNLQFSARLHELIGIARENDALGDHLHHFALAVIESKSLEDVLSTTQDMLRQEFRLDSVIVLFQEEPEYAGGRPEFVGAGDHRLAALLKRFRGSGLTDDGIISASPDSGASAARMVKPICGGRYDERMMVYLFGEQAPEIKSSAVIPLGGAPPRGVLCLGSRDPHRFHPEMGTVYLVKLGELLLRGVVRYLN